jgi:hypothetical protein
MRKQDGHVVLGQSRPARARRSWVRRAWITVALVAPLTVTGIAGSAAAATPAGHDAGRNQPRASSGGGHGAAAGSRARSRIRPLDRRHEAPKRVGSTTVAAPLSAAQAITAAAPVAAAPPITITAAPTTTPPTTTAAPPATASPSAAAAPSSGWGCGPAVAYLNAHAAPGFTVECPGDAFGHEAMTCFNIAGYCPDAKVIAIADPCPAAYMNEASNSWVVTGKSDVPIDPYGTC